MRKLRLLVTANCNRACPMCCNKGFDLAALPVCTSFNGFDGFDEIILTGGEPFVELETLLEVIQRANVESTAPIFVYTAWTNPGHLLGVLRFVDGITLTLHCQADVAPLVRFNAMLKAYPELHGRSLRLNVFDGIKLPEDLDLGPWQVKPMSWMQDCPLPRQRNFHALESSVAARRTRVERATVSA
ncbi:hypothetical protein [Magnetospirillum molischianum]|uniref:Radical SAM core domain-containing protein n=1 Tax=Magnetospirillum molischianum DSM 120 TaxID=1150626 RepID=H8FYE3_MAGML|nr:hypothetical protein [Magnetospirillum molischianum]CCG43381.1 putative Predicted protein [Magnetospirillum molischianum DSM 120]